MSDKVKASAIYAEAFRLEGEVARLTRERDEAIKERDRQLGCRNIAQRDRNAYELQNNALRTALTEVNDLLMSVPPGEDWRAVVREKVVKALFGEPGWKET